MPDRYDRESAVNYALKYAINPNNSYIYFQGGDCTNFVSQCMRAGGAKNNYNPSHPWWYANNKTSVCWSVAASFYWYIRVSSEENIYGINANTLYINGNNQFNNTISSQLQLGDIIQYRNYQGEIHHSTLITGFKNTPTGKEPLISQHSFNAVNISWRKKEKQTIFHHIISIN